MQVPDYFGLMCSSIKLIQFHHLSDFCDRLDEYGTGALNDLSADSADSEDEIDPFQKALNEIHEDLMFRNDVEELCVKVYIDETGKEAYNIIEC